MATLSKIVEFINQELSIAQFSDASLNGLQFEGSSEVKKIAASVDAGHSVIEKSIERGAQLLLVHHGLFWGTPLPLTNALARTVKTLVKGDLSLLAVHLPLDASEKYGNNFSLGRLLGLSELSAAAPYNGSLIGCSGINSKNQTLVQLCTTLENLPGAQKDFCRLQFGPSVPERICIVSGSAADQLLRFKEDGFDTFITGEAKQFAYHFCKENKLNALFAGHYATETLGAKNISKAVAEKYKIEYEFIDEPTGI